MAVVTAALFVVVLVAACSSSGDGEIDPGGEADYTVVRRERIWLRGYGTSIKYEIDFVLNGEVRTRQFGENKKACYEASTLGEIFPETATGGKGLREYTDDCRQLFGEGG